jgi:hypothetical protein
MIVIQIIENPLDKFHLRVNNFILFFNPPDLNLRHTIYIQAEERGVSHFTTLLIDNIIQHQWYMSDTRVWNLGVMILTGELKNSERNLCQHHFISPQNSDGKVRKKK